eukprot:scaffold4611_cov45-Cyclotella_meneghiniana.AAC.3
MFHELTFQPFDLDSAIVDRYTDKKFLASGFLLKKIFVRYENKEEDEEDKEEDEEEDDNKQADDDDDEECL